jgi:hypothetical protein
MHMADFSTHLKLDIVVPYRAQQNERCCSSFKQPQLEDLEVLSPDLYLRGRQNMLARQYEKSIFDTDLFEGHENMALTPMLNKRQSTHSHNSIFEGHCDPDMLYSPCHFADQARFELHLPKRPTFSEKHDLDIISTVNGSQHDASNCAQNLQLGARQISSDPSSSGTSPANRSDEEMVEDPRGNTTSMFKVISFVRTEPYEAQQAKASCEAEISEKLCPTKQVCARVTRQSAKQMAQKIDRSKAI